MGTVQVTEDQNYVFKPSDFTSGISGTFLGLKITSLPTTGTLYLNGVPVTVNEGIHASDISAGNFYFVPNTDSTATGSFTDNVGTSVNGVNTSTSSSTTLNVTADGGPSASGTSVQVTENQTYTFKTSDFGYSDSADKTSDPLGSVTVTTLPSDGTLELNGAPVSAGQSITASQISSGQLTFVPNANVTTAGSFNFKVTDSLGGTTSASAATMTVNMIAIGPAPSALASSVSVAEDQTYTFKASDFGYSDSADATSDPMASITITALSTNGTLKYNGTAITTAQANAGFTVTAANIGLLTFVPNTDVTTQGSFAFRVTDTNDNATSGTAATMTLNVTADAGPTAGASAVSVTEDQTYTFKASDFVYSDSADPTDAMASVTISSLPTTGTLKLSGTNVTAGQVITAANIPNLTFVPNTDVTTPGSFQFKVTDTAAGGASTTSATAATMTLNLTADAGPSASASAVTVTENQTYTFKTSDFGYSDSADKTTDPLGSVTVTSLPSTGTLQLSGAAVTANQTILASDIASGKLTFVPNTNVTTAGSFNFEVTDSLGGTTSATAAAMSLNISTDPGPTASASTVQVTEDVTYTFKASDFGYSDSFDPTDAMASVTINSLPTTGTLKLGANNVTAGQVITAANIPNLTFVPNTDVTAQGSFSFSVTDTTGQVTSSATTMTLKVTADVGPSALASSITATENQTYAFKISDFGYSDAADKTADPLGSVTITSLPGDGTLKLNGAAVTTNQSITAAQISSGQLTFVPNANVTTAGSFNFKVTDSLGGTQSASAAAMTLNIAAPGSTPSPQLSFAAQNFNTVGTDNSGFYMIPPDPNAAVGTNTVITATNGVLETFNKSGVLQTNTSLNNFFVAGLGSLVLTNFNDSNQSGPFDPKVIYDPYTNRFIVVALQESDAGGSFNDTNTSNILIAVSSPDTGGALTWKYTSINSDVIANGADSWADYPGLAVDGTGNIYITTNLFDHATGNYQGSRLWTIAENDIVTGAAGTNATATGKANIYDPSVLSGATSAGSSELFTLMPAQMLPGSGAFAAPSGTFLVSYDGAQNSQGQVLNVIQVTPQASGSPTFTFKQINLGNIDASGQFASLTAPQKGTSRTIDAGDNRIYSAVFRNGNLYATTTIIPTSSYDSANAGKTTAHWFQINASNPANLTLLQQGDVSGASIGSGVRTFYPSISVDANGDFAIGFSASGPNNYASAYYEAYKYNASSNTWTLETPTLLAGGVASYNRTFGGGANRWGDFSSVVPDPSSPSTFWVFNEFAWTQGTTISGESGRWATQVGEFTLPNTITGPVVASGGGTGSSQPAGSTSPSTSNPSLAQFADAGGIGHRQTSDINPNANPLVESDHGPAIAALSPYGPGIGSSPSQLAGSLSQLVQTMAGFGAGHEGIPSLSGTGQNDVANPSVLAANLFHHHG